MSYSHVRGNYLPSFLSNKPGVNQSFDISSIIDCNNSSMANKILLQNQFENL